MSLRRAHTVAAIAFGRKRVIIVSAPPYSSSQMRQSRASRILPRSPSTINSSEIGSRRAGPLKRLASIKPLAPFSKSRLISA